MVRGKASAGSITCMKNLLSPATLKKWMEKGLKPVSQLKGSYEIGLYLTENDLRIAISGLKPPVGREIVYLNNFNLQNLPDSVFVEEFQKICKTLSIETPMVVGIIPSHLVITRNIEVPSRDPKEIREIVSLQASRHTPYSRSEIIVDYLDLGVFKGVYSKILLVIVPRAAVNRYLNFAEQLKFRVEKIVFAPEAISQSLSTHPLLSDRRTTRVLVHVDAVSSDFMILSKAVLIFVRNIPIGAQDFAADKEGAFARLVEELKRSIEAYRSENVDQDPTSFVIAGALQGIENLDLRIHEALQMPAKVWNYQEEVSVQQETKSAFSNKSVSFLGVIAPLLIWKQLAIELIPEENRLRSNVERRAREIVKTGVLILICLCLISAIFLGQIYFRKSRVNILAKRFEPIRQEAESLEEIYARVGTVRNYLGQRGKAIESLAELYQVLPAEIYLTDVRFDEGEKFTLKGSSTSRPLIFSLATQLEDSPVFLHVQTKYVSGRTEEGKELSDFEIVASLE